MKYLDLFKSLDENKKIMVLVIIAGALFIISQLATLIMWASLIIGAIAIGSYIKNKKQNPPNKANSEKERLRKEFRNKTLRLNQ